MTKTAVQEKLEAQRGREIKDILIGLLERFKGRRYIAQLVSADLNISYATFYLWCRQFEIDVDQYRFPNDHDLEPTEDAGTAR